MNLRLIYRWLKYLTTIIPLAALTLCALWLIRTSYTRNDEADSIQIKENLKKMQLIHNSSRYFASNSTPSCKIPDLDIANPEILKFLHGVPPIKCSPADWVKADGPRLFIDKKAVNQYGPITCVYKEILRINDFEYSYTDAVESDSEYILRQSDYADVACETHSGKRWHGVLASVQLDPKATESWNNVFKESLKLNVLMFGFDSLSRITFIRKLPKSYRFLKETLNTLVLNGYNIVGDGTPQALIPILTGYTEIELPEVRVRMGSKAHFVDVYPMIWKDFKNSGFITSFMEDVPDIGTFTYRLKGFNNQPTDHYMRTYYMAASPFFSNYKKFCMGGIPRHKVMLNHIKAIFNEHKDKPKFTFGFHGELSHDSYNDIGAADDDLYNWIKELWSCGHLNNTILILMSDHGHRFADIRNTLQGKQEERLPFFSFTFPPWFKHVHPKAYSNFLDNTQVLTSPFDIYASLKHILNFTPPKDGDLKDRGISLFNKIPTERTCSDAFIETHWCACLSWKEIEKSDIRVQEATSYFIDFLNAYTADYRHICENVMIDEILWAAILLPTKDLIHFKKTRDKDGFLPDLSDNSLIKREIYQIKIRTVPGNALFEASISRDVEQNVYVTKISDVSRINKYGTQASCVENSLFHLRKFCYCKNK